jgi:hypothetical protein
MEKTLCFEALTEHARHNFDIIGQFSLKIKGLACLQRLIYVNFVKITVLFITSALCLKTPFPWVFSGGLGGYAHEVGVFRRCSLSDHPTFESLP